MGLQVQFLQVRARHVPQLHVLEVLPGPLHGFRPGALASHPAWNCSLATPNHPSDGELIRGKTATIASQQVPPVDGTEARNSQVSGVRIPECPQHLSPAFEHFQHLLAFAAFAPAFAQHSSQHSSLDPAAD
jgi:hypothetical protein